MKSSSNNLEEIEKFILNAGSDHLPIFGGMYEGGIQCQQIPDELAPCIKTIMDSGQEIKSYLEIGVAAGGTTYLIHHFLKPFTIVLLDDNKHGKAGQRAEILKGITYHEIIGNSNDEQTVTALENYMAEYGFDLIIIDADHSYHSVRIETVLYAPFLNPGGFLFLHDSVYKSGQVDRVVRELKKENRLEFVAEFISSKHPYPLGIALFRNPL